MDANIRSPEPMSNMETDEEQISDHENTMGDERTAESASPNGRIKGVTICKPIIIGNTAKYFGKKRETDGHTHEWSIYVKPYNSNEDYSSFIKKVHFKLHESYPNPLRVVDEAPFQINETGWGEFQIAIRIHFQDPTERPLTMYHILKLFEYQKNSVVPVVVNQVKFEYTDEIIFREPTVLMKSYLDSVKPRGRKVTQETNFETFRKNSAAEIAKARESVQLEIQEARAKLILARETIQNFQEKLNSVKHKEE